MARIFDYDVLEKIGEYGDYSNEKLVEINIPNELGLTKEELEKFSFGHLLAFTIEEFIIKQETL